MLRMSIGWMPDPLALRDPHPSSPLQGEEPFAAGLPKIVRAMFGTLRPQRATPPPAKGRMGGGRVACACAHASPKRLRRFDPPARGGLRILWLRLKGFSGGADA